MGNDKHTASKATYIYYFGKKHLFHVVHNEFPLPEEGIIGLPFFRQYQRYSITPEYLIIENHKLPLNDDGEYIGPHTIQINKITLPDITDQEVWIENNPHIPDGIYKIKNEKLQVPYSNYGSQPIKIQAPEYETITRINKISEVMVKKVQNTTNSRIKNLLNKTRLDHVEEKNADTIWKIVSQFSDVYTLDGDPLPCTTLTEHEIILKTGKIINIKSYRPPECHKEEVRRQVNDLLEKNVIKESNSPFNSPIWIVPKKSDASGKKKWRMVIDFRKINEDTDQDAYPLPVIDDILNQLGQAKFFSAFDLSSGFHQIPMSTNSSKYTGFSTPEGHFEFLRMPFGLKNAPATFQRMMDGALRGLIGKHCFVYLDDIVIFGSTIEEHNKNLILMLERLREVGLKLQPDKCEYLRPELEYLGHLITSEGVKPNPAKIGAIKNFKAPTNVKEVQCFLGLAGYYRKFIKNFSHIAKPLTTLIKKDNPFNWSEKHHEAFNTLKNALCTAPVLRFPDYNKEFTLTTDASNVGLGAVLSQDGHPCCFISRTLNGAEQNYSTSEKELLAIVWATQRLRQYLLGRSFNIQTDHQALKWLHNVKNPSSRLLRWRLRLEEFNYKSIDYIKGKENKVADCLSRLLPIHDDLQENIEKPEINIEDLENELPDIDEIITEDRELNTPTPQILTEEGNRDVIMPSPTLGGIEEIILEQDIPSTKINEEESLQLENNPELRVTEKIDEPSTSQEIVIANTKENNNQEDNDTTEYDKDLYANYKVWTINKTLTQVIKKANAGGKLWKKIQKRPSNDSNIIILPEFREEIWLSTLANVIQGFSNRGLTIVRLHFIDPTITPLEKIKLDEFLNYLSNNTVNKIHVCYSPQSELTQSEKGEILKEAHGSISGQHFGEAKSIDKARQLGEWRNMENDIIEFVKRCPICQLQKTTRIRRQVEAIIPDTPINPNDKVAMDIFGPLPITSSRNEYILSIQDQLTKYVMLIPLKTATSESIIEGMFDHFIYLFGAPKTILTDQGQNFVSELVQNFENLFRIKHIKTTTYHPQSNGSIERAHSTIKDLLKTCMADNGIEWDKTLKIIALAYNTTKHEGIGISPFQATFGRENANLPSSLATTPNLRYDDLIQMWKLRHEEYLQRAKEKIALQKEKYKQLQDSKIVIPQGIFEPKDKVKFVNNTKSNKLSQSWIGPAEVIERFDNNNYTIKFNDREIRLHANQLMPYYD